jgi:hypothetical protein
MSEYMGIHRDGQRAKWHHSNRDLAHTNPTDSIQRDHIDLCAALLAERPNLTGGSHVVYEKPNSATASRTLDVHVKNSVSHPDKSGIDAHT